MKKIFCDFCSRETGKYNPTGIISQQEQWMKIIISNVKKRPLDDKIFDACGGCAKAILELVKIFSKMYKETIEFDNSGEKPIHSEETMVSLRNILNTFHLHVNERCTSNPFSKELFVKCPKCEGNVEMVISGRAGEKWYFECPICATMVKFIQYDKNLPIGATRRIN